MAGNFGPYFKKKRLEGGLTLRRFCAQNEFDPANISKIERGLFPPPKSRKKLERYAVALGVQEGTDEWLEFFDLAAVEAGRLPDGILSNEAVISKLPLLFRTLNNKKFDEAKLDELVERIRRA